MKKVINHVKLTAEEREILVKKVRGSKTGAKEILHANILLLLDENNTDGNKTPLQTAKILSTTKQTINIIKHKYLDGGLDNAIKRKALKEPSRKPKITGEVEAKIIALACTKAPDGRAKWTIRLLTDKTIELQYIDSIGRMSVDRILKKHNLSLT